MAPDHAGGSGGPALPAEPAHGQMIATDDPGRMAASAIGCALQQAGVAPPEVAGVCVSANGDAAVAAAETAALQQIFGTRPLARLAPATLCGDTQGACTALQAALVVLQSAGAPVLVLTTEASGSSVALLLRAP